jgi:uncharacterized pyridoxamine 5'-phosphate oxidase family protein
MEDKKDINEKLLNFLKTQMLGVVSTVDWENNKPESAVVAFCETEGLELIFGTFLDTRKFKNIHNNPNVSFVIGWSNFTIQYEGIAKITDGEEASKCKEKHLKKNPASIKFSTEQRQRYIKVSPKWIRLTDFSNSAEPIIEVVL